MRLFLTLQLIFVYLQILQYLCSDLLNIYTISFLSVLVMGSNG